jgi:hypothetical protein
MHIFSESTGLYFYSAVFQGNMALLALSGIFAVFRLQQIHSQQRLLGQVIQDVTNAIHGRQQFPLSWVQPDRIADIRAKISELQVQMKSGRINPNMTEGSLLVQLEEKVLPRIEVYERLGSLSDMIGRSLSVPFGLTVGVIGTSLMLLMFARPLTLLSEWVLSATMVGTACLNICALMANVRFVFTALDTDVPRWAKILSCRNKRKGTSGGQTD